MKIRSYKLVTIITKRMIDNNGVEIQKPNLAVRVPRPLGQLQVDRGHATFTSKGRYKQILKDQRKKERREEIILANRKAREEKLAQQKARVVKKA